MALLETQGTQEMTLHRPTPVHIVDPAVAAVTSAKTTPCVQLTNSPVSFASTTQVRSDVPIPPYCESSCTLYLNGNGAHFAEPRCEQYGQCMKYITTPGS